VQESDSTLILFQIRLQRKSAENPVRCLFSSASHFGISTIVENASTIVEIKVRDLIHSSSGPLFARIVRKAAAAVGIAGFTSAPKLSKRTVKRKRNSKSDVNNMNDPSCQ
jgi:hypothetical protein